MPILSGLHSRERIAELMDDPNLDPVEHRCALKGLARINRLSGSVGVLWPYLSRFAAELARPLRILDVATGSGDVPTGIMKKAARVGIAIEIAGCDISPTAVAAAEANCPSGRFFQHDVLRDPLPTGYDAVTCSLFLHHLSTEEAGLVLRRMMEAAERCVLVNDLARSRFNYLSVALVCRTLSRSRVVRFDGPASVRSAFTATEALAIAERAGLDGARVRSRFPCRFLLSWERPQRSMPFPSIDSNIGSHPAKRPAL